MRQKALNLTLSTKDQSRQACMIELLIYHSKCGASLRAAASSILKSTFQNQSAFSTNQLLNSSIVIELSCHLPLCLSVKSGKAIPTNIPTRSYLSCVMSVRVVVLSQKCGFQRKTSYF